MSAKGVIVIIVLLTAVIALGLWGALRDHADRERLMAQCAADGKKEYQCRSIVR